MPIPLPVDSLLPTFGEAVEGSALAAWASEATGVGDVEVRPRYLRYKPANKAIVLHDVRLGGTWTCVVLTVAALRDLTGVERRDDAVELAARVRGRCPIALPIAYVPELAALAEWYPAKLDMPGLSRLEAVAGVLPDPSAVLHGEPQLISYKPERRAVLRWGRAFLKTYVGQADHDEAWTGLAVGRRLNDLVLARPLADLPALRLTVQTEIAGRPAEPEDLDAVGEALARLHAGPIDGLPQFGAGDHLEAARRTADHLAAVHPELAVRLQQLVDRLRACCPVSEESVLSHGDLHLAQALVVNGNVALIDLDRACAAVPGYDVATCGAHLVDRDAISLDRGRAGLDRLVAGYGPRPAYLDWYLAVAILRRAAAPFRFLRPDWPERVALMVAAADDALPG